MKTTTAAAFSIATLTAALFAANTPATKAETPAITESAPGRQISVTKEDTAFKLSSKWTVCTKDNYTVTQDTSLHVSPLNMSDAYWQNTDDLKRSYDLLDESTFNVMSLIISKLTQADVQAMDEARKAGNPLRREISEDEAPLVRAVIFQAIMFEENLTPVTKAIEKDEGNTSVAISNAPSPLCK